MFLIINKVCIIGYIKVSYVCYLWIDWIDKFISWFDSYIMFFVGLFGVWFIILFGFW